MNQWRHSPRGRRFDVEIGKISRPLQCEKRTRNFINSLRGDEVHSRNCADHLWPHLSVRSQTRPGCCAHSTGDGITHDTAPAQKNLPSLSINTACWKSLKKQQNIVPNSDRSISFFFLMFQSTFAAQSVPKICVASFVKKNYKDNVPVGHCPDHPTPQPRPQKFSTWTSP